MDFLGFCTTASIFIFVGSTIAKADSKIEKWAYYILGFLVSSITILGLWKLTHSIPDVLWGAGAMLLGYMLGVLNTKK